MPVYKELFPMYGQLDNYLHAQWGIPIGLPDDSWRKENSRKLRAFAEKLIPPASPQNSLDYLSIPKVKFEEIDISAAEIILRKYWLT